MGAVSHSWQALSADLFALLLFAVHQFGYALIVALNNFELQLRVARLRRHANQATCLLAMLTAHAPAELVGLLAVWDTQSLPVSSALIRATTFSGLHADA